MELSNFAIYTIYAFNLIWKLSDAVPSLDFARSWQNVDTIDNQILLILINKNTPITKKKNMQLG